MRQGSIIILGDRGDPLPERLQNDLKAYADCHVGVFPDGGSSANQLKDAACVILGASAAHSIGGALGAAAQMRRSGANTPILLATAYCSEEVAIAALRSGIHDLIKLPDGHGELLSRIQALSVKQPAEPVNNSIASDMSIVGESEPIRHIREYTLKVAASGSTILITGETGTGKELIADLLHRRSPRARKPMVTINCAAIPDSLLESELFGHERGSFTGAHTSQDGKLGMANGGTLFLDEIGEMTPYAQAKMLRALESREIYRVGGRAPIRIDVRFIAATNQSLEKMVETGAFRKDLFYRLNVARITLPSLRERKEDIPLLTSHFIAHFNRVFGRSYSSIPENVMNALMEYDWPGNIRELKNVIEAMYLAAATEEFTADDLPATFRRNLPVTAVTSISERDTLLRALLATNWNKSKAAEQLNWSRMTVYRKMAKYNLLSELPSDSDLTCELA